jgi:hypothetical protein
MQTDPQFTCEGTDGKILRCCLHDKRQETCKFEQHVYI